MAARGNQKLVLLCLLLAACGRDRQEAPPPEPTDSVPPARTMEPLSDNEALDVLMALSAAGASTAASSPDLVRAPELRRYLNVVRADHQALSAELRIIADSLELTPEPNPAGDRIRTAASPANVPAGGNIDAAVLEQQVALHRIFLAALDSAVPGGQRAELLAQYTTALRPTVSAHLQRAEQLQRLLRDRALAARPRPTVPGTPAAAPAGTAEPGTVPRAMPPETTGAARPDTLPGG